VKQSERSREFIMLRQFIAGDKNVHEICFRSDCLRRES
jgi:hypothetical protein